MSVEEQAMGPDQEATESDVVSDVTDSTDVINANDVADAADGTDTESAEGVDAESTESAEDAETQKSERPTRHAMIMRGVVTPIFGLLAVAAIVLGVLNDDMEAFQRDHRICQRDRFSLCGYRSRRAHLVG